MAESPYSELIAEVHRLTPRIVALRQDLHRIPELSGEEEETAARIVEELAETDLALRTGIAETGIAADLDTGRPGPYLLLRADMDALPIEDRSAEECRSQRPGYSHSCGHDGHSAVLVGVVHALSALREHLTGKIRFVFQPAEERATGARAMLEDGLLDDGTPDAAIALHATPGLAPNTVAAQPGVVAASNDAFTVEVHGRGGHSSRPAEAKNPLEGMARLIQILPTLSTSQRIVTVCRAIAGETDNVIPETGALTGTSRALNRALRQQTKEQLKQLAIATCEELGFRAMVTFREGSPPVINDGGLVAHLFDVCTALTPHVLVEKEEGTSMGGEDFSFFAEDSPGILYRLGTGVDSPALHTPEFGFHDDAVPTGMLTLAGMALRLCNPQAEKP